MALEIRTPRSGQVLSLTQLQSGTAKLLGETLWTLDRHEGLQVGMWGIVSLTLTQKAGVALMCRVHPSIGCQVACSVPAVTPSGWASLLAEPWAAHRGSPWSSWGWSEQSPGECISTMESLAGGSRLSQGPVELRRTIREPRAPGQAAASAGLWRGGEPGAGWGLAGGPYCPWGSHIQHLR